jgi:hypothetical protein
MVEGRFDPGAAGEVNGSRGEACVEFTRCKDRGGRRRRGGF